MRFFMSLLDDFKEFDWHFEDLEGETYRYLSLRNSLNHAMMKCAESGKADLSELFRLLVGITLLQFTNNKDHPYLPLFLQPIDFIEKEIVPKIDILEHILPEIKDLFLKGRVSDLLWLYSNSKNKVSFADIAIQQFILLEGKTNIPSMDILECWRRAIVLTKKIRRDDKTGEIYTILEKHIETYQDEGYYKLRVANIIHEFNLDQNKENILAEKIINIANGKDSTSEKIDYLEFACRALNKYGNFKRQSEIHTLRAKLLEERGDELLVDSAFSAIHWYKLSLHELSNIHKAYREELNFDKLSSDIRSKITQKSKIAVNQLDSFEILPIDVTALMEQAANHVSNKKSSTLALCYFAGLCETPNYQTLKSSFNPSFVDMFSYSKPSTDGRIITSYSGLDSNDEKSFNELAEKHAINLFCQSVLLQSKAVILPALEQINKEYSFGYLFFETLCDESSIVPNNRKKLMSKALFLGMNQDFTGSVHLLSPQFENLIREIFRNAGISTTIIDKNHVEQEKGLSTLMNMDEAKSLFDESLLFEIKCIFTDSQGFNLRNDIAHGLVDDDHIYQDAYIYAWAMTIRLIIQSYINDREELNDV